MGLLGGKRVNPVLRVMKLYPRKVAVVGNCNCEGFDYLQIACQLLTLVRVVNDKN
jgi:hypothetical protein